MPSWCTLYKGLFTLAVCLIALEYFFGTVIETTRWESVFTFNNSRIDKNVEQIHSPLLKSLRGSSAAAAKRQATVNRTRSAEDVPSDWTFFVNASAMPPRSATSSNSSDYSSLETSTRSNSKLVSTTDIPLCPENPPGLGTTVKVIKSSPASITELERRFSWLEEGGHGRPEGCTAPKKVALIVPFRCRAEHLLLFLQHMHPFLRKQQIDYTMFIIEQDGRDAFNRARLMNVGYVEALKIERFDCFIFHDIDLLPEDERNLYTCPITPRHMSAAVDVFNYKLPYQTIFGGVSAITTEDFRTLNGFSNSFWGWGGEDDDMANRVAHHKMHVSRYPLTIARYVMLDHKKEKANPNRYETLKKGQKLYDTDGLSNLKYTLKQLKRNLLYTWILVDISPTS